MDTVAIIQARMNSTRLPGKVLLDLRGETVLGRVIQRLRRSRLIDRIVIATTVSSADDAIVRVCQRLAVETFRGSAVDVLDRYYQAAKKHTARSIVRITSDCPLIDPEVVDQAISAFLEQHADYASNVLTRTYPRGLDTEVFTLSALNQAWCKAREPYEREHVTPYFFEHPEHFHLASVRGKLDYSRYRWTIDTADDLQLVREIYARVGNPDNFSWQQVIALLEREPSLAEINADVLQKAVHED